MKKTISILLILTLVFSLSACGGSAPAEAKTETAAEAAPQEAEKNFKVGTVDGNVYSSETAGIRFTIDDNWVFLDDEGIEEITGIVQYLTDDEAMQETMDKGASIYDMYAMANDGSGRTANITVENLGALYGTLLSEDAYIDLVEEQLAPSFEGIGATDVSVEKTTFDIAGAQHSGVYAKVEFQGISIHTGMICIKAGRYMYCISCSARSEEEMMGIVSMFSAQ